MKRIDVIKAAPLAALAACAGGSSPLGRILTPQSPQSRGIELPQTHGGIAPLAKEYNCGSRRLIGPFTGTRQPTVYFEIWDSATNKIVGTLDALFGSTDAKPYMSLVLTIDGKSVSETFYNDESHILKWTEKHPVKAFNKLFRIWEAEYGKMKISLLNSDGSRATDISIIDNTWRITDYGILVKGKPLTGQYHPWSTTSAPLISGACAVACILLLGAFMALINASALALDPETAPIYGAAMAAFTAQATMTQNICAQ